MTSAENPYAGQGMVVLDIGDDIGALIVSAPARMAGVEIEICPSGARHHTPDEGAGWWQDGWRSHTHPHTHSHTHDGGSDATGPVHTLAPAWPHVAVLPRRTPAARHYAAVFPGLRAGCYDLWKRPDGPTALTVTVTGGQVGTADWPDVAISGRDGSWPGSGPAAGVA